MVNKQIVLNIPEWTYKEIDRLSKHKVEKYLSGLVQKMVFRPRKQSITKIFDVFKTKEQFSLEHDKHLYK